MRKKLTMNKSNTMTFGMGFEEYIDNCKARNLRPATIKHYKEGINTIYKFIDSSTPIEELTKDVVDKFVISCKENLKINDVTLHTYLRDLKTLMYYFMKCGYIPTFKIQLIKVDKKPVETYTDGELKKLLKKPDTRLCSFSEYRNWVLINFLLSTGVRLNSFMNIRIKDLDFDNEVVYINVTKNRKTLIIPLNKIIIKILKDYLKIRQHNNDEEYLFCNVYGNQLNKNTISEALRQYNYRRGITKSGITKSGIHRYRHTFAKKWIISGGNVVTLQKILGHSSLLITENYVNILVSDLKKEVNQFNILEEFRTNHIKIKK